MAWRKINRSAITSISDVVQPWSPDALTVLPLNMLRKVLLSHCEGNSNVKVVWDAKVTSCGSDNDGKGTWVDVTGKDGEKRWKADYVCGCDRANSAVRRRCLRACFRGRRRMRRLLLQTYSPPPPFPISSKSNKEKQLYHPFKTFGYDDIKFIIHNEDYYMAAKITTDGLWRVSYGEDAKHTPEQVIAHQPAEYERLLPGHPKPGDYKLLSVGPCRIHQRCAPKLRVGRIMPAADAAHLCNPFGGLELTGGLVDVGGLALCLAGIETGVAGDEILDT